MKAVDEASVSPAPYAARLRALAKAASIEVTPRRILHGPPLSSLLAPGSSVYVPYLPAASFHDTLAACQRLLADGMLPIPHLAPRTIASRDAMQGILGALADLGVECLLLIAGDKRRPAGCYSSTLDLLESGLLTQHGFRRLGVAGHPDGHPSLSARELEHALAAKGDYAAETGSELWIVTQFLFTTGPLFAWLERLHDAGNTLPVRVGLPGPARLRTLIAYAAQCGVSASARILARRPGAARLLTYWTPDGLLRDLAYYRTPAPPLAGIHLFPFGGVEQSIRWLGTFGADSSNTCPSDSAGVPPA